MNTTIIRSAAVQLWNRTSPVVTEIVAGFVFGLAGLGGVILSSKLNNLVGLNGVVYAGFIVVTVGVACLAVFNLRRTWQLSKSRRRKLIVVGLAVLLVGGIWTAAAAAPADQPDSIQVEKTGPTVQTSVENCSDETCRVTVYASDWDAVHVAAVENKRTGEVRYLGPDQPVTTFESVQRDQETTANGEVQKYPNELVVYIPIKDPVTGGYESKMWIYLNTEYTDQQELFIFDLYNPEEGDVTFDGETERHPTEKPNIGS